METYTIAGKEYPVVGLTTVINEEEEVMFTRPIVDIPQISDYKWQLGCLKSRLEHPENYADSENVEENIAKLCQWLEENKEKATAEELRETATVLSGSPAGTDERFIRSESDT